MMKIVDRMTTSPRERLDQLMRASGESFVGLGRILNRKPDYLRGHVRRGRPAQLEESELKLLAAYLGVGEHEIGGTESIMSEERTTYRAGKSSKGSTLRALESALPDMADDEVIAAYAGVTLGSPEHELLTGEIERRNLGVTEGETE